MITEQIWITGMVQGIGFRPFVAELAEEYGLCGTVWNYAGSVQIIVSGEKTVIEAFVGALQKNAPAGACLESVIREQIDTWEFEGFSIVPSKEGAGEPQEIEIPADLPTCKNCERELSDCKNRRYRYPFLSCTACGPRYSIIEQLPYDRDKTVMREFALCKECEREYTKKGDIRRHAQTIACAACGPTLSFLTRDKKIEGRALQEEAFAAAVTWLKNGGILAIKDIGGFHLASLVTNEETVLRLRRLKGREKKPFAVMFRDSDTIKRYCEVNREEDKLLKSAARPIVLLKKKECAEQFFAKEVSKHSPDVGAMLPCNPLQILLMQEFEALIMTSANRSGEPILTENATVREWMEQSQIPFAILSHDRKIVTPLDDSIVRVVHGRTQTFRRARGYVPQAMRLSGFKEKQNRQIFAAGADLKSVFCFVKNGKAYFSQHLGDMEDEKIQKLYRTQYERMKNLFEFTPEVFVKDMHPAYATGTHIPAKSVPIAVQHHHAHVASVMAEHGLEGAVLGVAFDGTGYGTDAAIWGSEFLLCEKARMKRAAHLKQVTLIGGDEGVRNADTILYGYLASFHESELIEEVLKKTEWFQSERAMIVKKAINRQINCVKSTSMGRLFDAVSAFLGICHYSDYEGEAAIELEYAAAKTKQSYPLEITLVKQESEEEQFIGDTESLFLQLAKGMSQGVPVEELARGFLLAVGDFTVQVCERTAGESVKKIALGGGTFQNRILLEYVTEQLEARGYQVYFNEQIPSGDGGICLGQAYLAAELGGLECV